MIWRNKVEYLRFLTILIYSHVTFTRNGCINLGLVILLIHSLKRLEAYCQNGLLEKKLQLVSRSILSRLGD